MNMSLEFYWDELEETLAEKNLSVTAIANLKSAFYIGAVSAIDMAMTYHVPLLTLRSQVSAHMDRIKGEKLQ